MRTDVKTVILFGAAALWCVPCLVRAQNADERLRAIYTEEWKWRLKQFPGLEGVEKPVPDRLPKVDPATQEMQLGYWEDVLHKLDDIPRAQLSSEEQINYDVYRPEIENFVADQKFRDYEMPANSDSAFWTDLGQTARRPFKTLMDYKNWIAQMREFVTLDLPPDEIHQIGLAQVAKLHQQMVDAMHESGFKGEFPEFMKFLRDDPQFYAKTPQDLLNRAAWIAKVFDGKSSQYFGYLPRMRFAIKPVPPDLAPFYTSGRGGPGVYLLNTYDLPHRPLYNLPALTLHESAPGHAFQIPIALEHKDQPEFRQFDYISAYGEGWALYCEKLGQEMGMYETPYERFGMLGYQIWRAARLVVDTGVHSKGWTREQALKYMHDYTALPEHEDETEVHRYIPRPGQALP